MRSWIHHAKGRHVRQARVGLGDLREEHISRQGFFGPVAMVDPAKRSARASTSAWKRSLNGLVHSLGAQIDREDLRSVPDRIHLPPSA
jgi:hypothetical protein